MNKDKNNLNSFYITNNRLYSDDVCFVSLGVNCYSRILIESVFDVRKMYSCDHRLPFDGSIHRFKTLINVFNTDFSHFDSTEYLDYDGPKLNNPRGQKFKNTFYGSLYPHESGKDDIFDFSLKQKKRVNEFKNIMNSGKKIVFLITLYNDEHNEYATALEFKLHELNQCIKNKFPKTNYLLVLAIHGLTESIYYKDNICVIQIPLRRNDFSLSDFGLTEWGIEFSVFLFSTIFKLLKMTIYPELNVKLSLEVLIDEFPPIQQRIMMQIPLDKEISDGLYIKDAHRWMIFKRFKRQILISTDTQVNEKLKKICGVENENSHNILNKMGTKLKSFDISKDKFYSDDLCFISLGFNCLPRILIDKLFDVEKMYSCDHRLPFDGSVHQTPNLFHVLDTGFFHFSSEENLVEGMINGLTRRFGNSFYQTNYLHENCNDTIEDFSQKQKKRVDAFRKLMNSGKKIIFFKYYEVDSDPTKPYKLSQLRKSIKNLFPHTDFYIVGLTKGVSNSVEYNKNVCVIQMPLRCQKFEEYHHTFKNEYGIECLGFLFSTIFKVLKLTIYPQMDLLENLKLLNHVKLPKLKESMGIPLNEEKNPVSIEDAELWKRFKSFNDNLLVSSVPFSKPRLKDLCGDEDENS